MKALKLTVAASLLAVVTACTTRGDVQTPVDDKGSNAATSGAQTGADVRDQAQPSGANTQGGFRGDALDDPSSPLSQRVIYFDYDSAEIKPEYTQVLRAHAQYLAANPQSRVIVEGHTDERGSREYNLALGERRADAIKKVLVLNGANAAQLEAVSYGEEKPALMGGSEDAWSKNRRAELTYTQR